MCNGLFTELYSRKVIYAKQEDLMDITGRQRMVVHFLLSHLLLHKQPGRVRNVQLKQELDAPGFIEEGVKVAARAFISCQFRGMQWVRLNNPLIK